jgi:hypothetical protein
MTDGLFIRQVAFELLTLDTFWKFTRFIQISNNFERTNFVDTTASTFVYLVSSIFAVFYEKDH